MQKTFILLSLAGAALLCGCGKQTKINTEEIKLLSQQMVQLQQSQAKQMAAIQSQLTSLAPMLDKLAEPMSGKIKFLKVNIDESPGLAQNFQKELEERTAWALKLQAENSELHARLVRLYSSLWTKLGRALRLSKE